MMSASGILGKTDTGGGSNLVRLPQHQTFWKLVKACLVFNTVYCIALYGWGTTCSWSVPAGFRVPELIHWPAMTVQYGSVTTGPISLPKDSWSKLYNVSLQCMQCITGRLSDIYDIWSIDIVWWTTVNRSGGCTESKDRNWNQNISSINLVCPRLQKLS